MSVSCLVIVRAGDSSLHPLWIADAHPEWDLAVSYFGDDDEKSFNEAAFAHRFKGGKWDGLHAFFVANPNVLARYQYFWLPDDDIRADATTITALFRAMEKYRLELAQPALTIDSYFQTPITLANRLFALRYTTMVEIMVPVLDRKLLAAMLPHFAETRTGFGLDYFWHRLTSDPQRKAAILDEITVTHTRPIGIVLAGAMGRIGVDPEKERETITAKLNVRNYHAVAFAGRLRNGKLVATRPACALLQILGLAGQFYRSRWQGRTHKTLAWKYYKLLRYGMSQIRHSPDLARIRST
jgi:hypothetical protein